DPKTFQVLFNFTFSIPGLGEFCGQDEDDHIAFAKAVDNLKTYYKKYLVRNSNGFKSFNTLFGPNNDQKLINGSKASSPEIADENIDFLPLNFEMPSSESQSSSE